MVNNSPSEGKANDYSPIELKKQIEVLKNYGVAPINFMAEKYGNDSVTFFLQLDLPKSKVDLVLKDVMMVFAMESFHRNEQDEGLRYFYTTHRRTLFAYLKNYSLFIPLQDQEEMVQDTFIVFNKLACSGSLRKSYFSKGTPVLSVLYGILKITILKYLSKKANRAQLNLDKNMLLASEIPDSAFDVLVADQKNELVLKVKKCFSDGPEYCIGLFSHLLYYDIELYEYAERAGLSQEAARKQKSRCNVKLKTCLGLPLSDAKD